MKRNRVRPIAIGVFRRGDSILAAEGIDPVKEQVFYRPLGGKIEFGEMGDQTVARELEEEIAVRATNLRYLCTLQNIFTYNGYPAHEIVLVYEGDLNREAYEADLIMGIEGNGETIKAVWKSLADFGPETPLYPDGLLELLTGRAVEVS